jgi:hypothetical protein
MIKITLGDGTKIEYNNFDEIGNYCEHRIIKFCCPNNGLTLLPDIIRLMTNLQELNCCHNRLTILPESIGYLEYTN